MADFFTDLAAGQNSALTDLSKAPNLRSYGGDVRYADVKVSVPNTVAVSDIIKLVQLPAGARLVPALCSVDYGQPAATALTGKLGDSLDDDRYGASLALGATAGRKRFDEAGTKGDAFVNPFKLTKDDWITFIPTTVTGAAAHTQTWHIAYTLG